ncbi:hypothetical protein OPT61_g10044 [Boeremia exigua]|uniref:Uncharacterized protein n=1 Tax=Boeremia exigua TaxID=749465 RepID=A0ACC2HRG9_9PLEO|nr:hypothetical protein OPT61_g10044 [Boeremia exigua]
MRTALIENGNRLGDDPRDDSEHRHHDDPRRPPPGRVDVAQHRVLEHAAVDIAQRDGRVDGARDENNGERDAERDLGDQGAGGQQGGRLDAVTDESVAQRARQRVDADLDCAGGPDGLHVVLGRVHFVHEGELADGEAEGEDDVGYRDEGFGEGEVFFGPGGPGDGGYAAGLVAGLDARRDDGDADCD